MKRADLTKLLGDWVLVELLNEPAPAGYLRAMPIDFGNGAHPFRKDRPVLVVQDEHAAERALVFEDDERKPPGVHLLLRQSAIVSLVAPIPKTTANPAKES